MTADLGYGMTLVALGLAVYGGLAAGIGAKTGRLALVESAQHAALGVFALVTSCFALLTYAFLTFDFSVRYVATNTNLGTPFYYRITAVWGALEGSIILWSWMLALYTIILIVRHRVGARELYPWALATMLGILAFFLLVMTVAAPPFQRQTPVPPDGRGLNPLLEDTGMITHPVALYLGFTGFTVPFAFAMAALITGRIGDTWLALTRRWTIVAWYFLSLGLLIGGWWSYHVLGWGGYWAWDPVENAAFMPWLTGTAFLHSVMIQERRRMLRLWNISLVILTFGLTLFGTFLTRSGVIASVHAFTQGSIGILFLSFLALVLLTALGLIAWRRASLDNLKRNFLWPVALGIVAATAAFALGVRSFLAVLTFATTVFVAVTIVVDFTRATRARLRLGESLLPAMGRLLVRHNRRYGGFVVHLGILIIALGVMGSHAWSVQTETTLRRGETAELAGYRFRFNGLTAVEESNHFKVVGDFTVSNGRVLGVLRPAKKFYPQEQAPIAYVDYRLGLREDLYLVLGDFARDGSQATIKLQVNRLVSWIWIGGFVLTLGALLAILPERHKTA